ncbi:Rho-type GTPase activating protein Rga1 [Podospora pseudopauciseta]|uniref:Rho-type GTPase activating protein Rga1 n=1 Tax=Podospora pseudopauciseta TaxID=2093780 RepID=A0ABR0HZT7_9PEZI|nr:Rho-type GTPase activating protein Rga1 [Podospora pseudopauciseta]
MAGYDYGGAGGGAPGSLGLGGGDWAHGDPRGNPHGHPHNGRAPNSPAAQGSNGEADLELRQSGERNRSRPRQARTASGQVRVCKKCGEPLTGQFVRALDGTFHLDCFKCRDCGQIVASKFFPAEDENGEGQYPLCETDYFRRLGLLCHQCGGALRGSYITALDRKYHVDHFTCSLCPTVFGAQDSYYEHDGQVYCHYHYSTQFAQRCSGCQTSILKQFVEIFRNGQNQHWHPECYMIHKFWNVRLNSPQEAPVITQDDTAGREHVRGEEERMEEKVYRIWSVLSTFEESSAACISDMLLHVSNGAYVDGVMVAKKFIFHVDILFRSADRLDATMSSDVDPKSGLAYGREAKLLCKKIVAFFSLLSKTQDRVTRKPGVTQELLTLVTGLAHYLKLLIRICLQGALRIEKERNSPDGLYNFLDDLSDLEVLKLDDHSTTTLQLTSGMSRLSAHDSDQCILCHKPIEDECAKSGDKRWHLACVNCSHCGKELGRKLQEARLKPYDTKVFCSTCDPHIPAHLSPFEHITKLQQYVFLLQVALARLLEILRVNGALDNGDDPNGGDLDSAEGRSRQQGGDYPRHHRESSYESALNDVRRLKSTRMDKHLSSSFRKARTSRILDGPESSSVRPGSAGGTGEGGQSRGFHIVDERGPIDEEDMTLPNQDALTLDDIPRIVAAEQAAREQRSYQPNQNRQELFRSPATEPRLGAGGANNMHQRSLSDGKGVGSRGLPDQGTMRGTRRYFSELSGLEYFIVRHLAVMTMHPMVENEFTLEELLGFIENKKAPTFWKNIGKAFKNDKQKAVKKKGVFGVPLEVIIERDGCESTDGVGPGTLKIPSIIDDIISAMKQMDLSVEGVFRKSGNLKKLGEVAEALDREEDVDFSSTHVVQLAALLKRYLRELPDPLMTQKLYRLWLTAAKIPDPEKRKHCLHLACCLLPKANRDCLEVLFCFLKWVGSFHQVDDESGSKMDIRNLATVIAPNVLLDANKAASLDSDPMFAIQAVEVIIASIEEMCLVPDDLADLLQDQSLFNNSAELTTKEILKRFGDRAANGPIRQYSDVGELMGRHDNNPSRPPPRRIETDPASWQQESSVRPMQEPTIPAFAAAATPPVQGTPPPHKRGPYDPPQQSPYRGPEAGNQGHLTPSQPPQQQPQHNQPQPGPPGQGNRGEWRNSGWGRQNNGLTTGTA